MPILVPSTSRYLKQVICERACADPLKQGEHVISQVQVHQRNVRALTYTLFAEAKQPVPRIARFNDPTKPPIEGSIISVDQAPFLNDFKMKKRRRTLMERLLRARERAPEAHPRDPFWIEQNTAPAQDSFSVCIPLHLQYEHHQLIAYHPIQAFFFFLSFKLFKLCLECKKATSYLFVVIRLMCLRPCCWCLVSSVCSCNYVSVCVCVCRTVSILLRFYIYALACISWLVQRGSLHISFSVAFYYYFFPFGYVCVPRFDPLIFLLIFLATIYCR